MSDPVGIRGEYGYLEVLYTEDEYRRIVGGSSYGQRFAEVPVPQPELMFNVVDWLPLSDPHRDVCMTKIMKSYVSYLCGRRAG